MQRDSKELRKDVDTGNKRRWNEYEKLVKRVARGN